MIANKVKQMIFFDFLIQLFRESGSINLAVQRGIYVQSDSTANGSTQRKGRAG